MLIVDDENQINWLIKAICLLKFEMPQNDVDVLEISGSPFIADLLDKAYDELISILSAKGEHGRVYRIEQNRNVENNHLVLSSVKQHLINIQKFWKNCDLQEKKQYLKILFSPYRASDEFLDEYVINVDDLF